MHIDNRLCVVIMPPPASDAFEMQATIDAMTMDEADRYLAMLRRRDVTARQREYAAKFPIWEWLLKPKLDKLDNRNDIAAVRRDVQRASQ